MIQLQPELINLLQLAYSAERAASFAYQGHAAVVKLQEEKESIYQIELDEWEHRTEVLKIMQSYNIPISRWYEMKYFIIGKIISMSCYLIGWFMPMIDLFHQLNITKYDAILTEMGLKEKEHEIYFLNKIKQHKWLPFFEKVFNWGNSKSFNSVNENELK